MYTFYVPFFESSALLGVKFAASIIIFFAAAYAGLLSWTFLFNCFTYTGTMESVNFIFSYSDIVLIYSNFLIPSALTKHSPYSRSFTLIQKKFIKTLPIITEFKVSPYEVCLDTSCPLLFIPCYVNSLPSSPTTMLRPAQKKRARSVKTGGKG